MELDRLSKRHKLVVNVKKGKFVSFKKVLK